MKNIIAVIPIHSFVDLITNSSSELFISATDKTIDTAKEMIDKLTGGKCDELFDVSLVYADYNYRAKEPKYILVDSEEGREYEKENKNENDDTEASILVVAKDNSPEHKKAAELINIFIGTYTIYDSYNG